MLPQRPTKKRKKKSNPYVIHVANAPNIVADDPYVQPVSSADKVLCVSQNVRFFCDISESSMCIVLPRVQEGSVSPTVSQQEDQDQDPPCEQPDKPQKSEKELCDVLEGIGCSGEVAVFGQLLCSFMQNVRNEMKHDLQDMQEKMANDLKKHKEEINHNPFHNYSMSTIKHITCVEALKVLEEKFKAGLESYGGLQQNSLLMARMKPVMRIATQIDKPNPLWYLDDSIGAIAEAICLLYEAKDKSIDDVEFLPNLYELIEDAENFFWDVLSLGMGDLAADFDKLQEELGEEGVCVLGFFQQKENLSKIIVEWSQMSAKRKLRNQVAHPFGDHLNQDVRFVASDLLGALISDPFCSKFQNLAILSKANLQLVQWRQSHAADLDAWIIEIKEGMEKVLKPEPGKVKTTKKPKSKK